MKNKFTILGIALFFSFSVSAQEFAKNSVSINTSGPIQAFGFAWGHQLTPKTTLTVFYVQGVPNSIENFDWEPTDADGNPNTESALYGVEFDAEFGTNSSWQGVNLNYRPFDNFDAFRVVFGGGVGSLGGTLVDPEGARYLVRGGGTFSYLGLGYGLKPVKGFQWGVDLGILRTGTFEVSWVPGATGNQTWARGIAITEQANSGHWIPNLQLTIGWGF